VDFPLLAAITAAVGVLAPLGADKPRFSMIFARFFFPLVLNAIGAYSLG
jgi:hypothetical protein